MVEMPSVHARELLLASNAQVQRECLQLTPKLREALAEVRDRVTRDELPLLSLLQAEPLQLQSSHLSFQEYFAACALCEKDTVLSGIAAVAMAGVVGKRADHRRGDG